MNRNRNIFKLLFFILLVCFTAGCQQGTSGDQPSPVTQTTDSIKQQTDLSQSQQVNELKSQNDMLLQRSRFTTGGVAMILGIVALLAFLAFNSRWTRRIEIKNRQLQRERNVVIAQNKQLAIERDRAEAASKAKTAFIRSMTHEIRTPLNAISGFSQVLILDGDALEADERLDMFIRISDGIRRLTNILDDLILSQAIHNVIPMVPKGVMLENQSELSPELTVKTNSRAVQNVLTKLLDNAAKFTTEGHIRLTATLSDDKLQLSVSDTGPGIPEDRREFIFERFAKIDSFSQGAGLGLTAARLLAEHIGGTLTLDTEYSGGSKFDLIIPIT